MRHLILLLTLVPMGHGLRLLQRQGGVSPHWAKIQNALSVIKEKKKDFEDAKPLAQFQVTSAMLGDATQIGFRTLPPHSSRRAPVSADGSTKYQGVLRDIMASYEEAGPIGLSATGKMIDAVQRTAQGNRKVQKVKGLKTAPSETAYEKPGKATELLNKFKDSITRLKDSLHERFVLPEFITGGSSSDSGSGSGSSSSDDDEGESGGDHDDLQYFMQQGERDVDKRWDELEAAVMARRVPLPRAETAQEIEIGKEKISLWSQGMDGSRAMVLMDYTDNMNVIDGVSKAAGVVSLWALKHPDADRFRTMPSDVKKIIARIFSYCLLHQLSIWFQNDNNKLNEELRNQLSRSLHVWAMSFMVAVTETILDMDGGDMSPFISDVDRVFLGDFNVIKNPRAEEYQTVAAFFEQQARTFRKFDGGLNDLPDVAGCPGRAVFVRETMFRLMAATVDSLSRIVAQDEENITAIKAEDVIYNARAREVVFHFSNLLGVSPIFVEFWEKELGIELSEGINAVKFQTEANAGTFKKRTLTAGLMLGVGVVVCVGTMAVAVPAIVGASAAGASLAAFLGGSGFALVVGLKAVGVALATKVGSLALVAAFGTVGAGLGGWKLSHTFGRLKGFDLTVFRTPHDDRQAAYQVVMAASGLLNEATPDAFQEDWIDSVDYTFSCADTYAVEWEVHELEALNRHVLNLVTTYIVNETGKAMAQHMVKAFFTGSLYQLFLPLAGIKMVLGYDTTWKVLTQKAKVAGLALSEALTRMDKIGVRPVQLVGYGMGALVIFHCLRALFARGAFHTVSDAFMLSLPMGITNHYEPGLDAFGEISDWNAVAGAVSGRIVNGYCPTDWLLLVLQWYQKSTPIVAGTFPTKGIPRIENIDLSPVIADSRDYKNFMREALTVVGFSHAAAFIEPVGDAERLVNVVLDGKVLQSW